MSMSLPMPPSRTPRPTLTSEKEVYDEEIIERRMRDAMSEMSHHQEYDYIVSHSSIPHPKSFALTCPELKKLQLDDVESLDMIRLVFMNRWIEAKTARGNTYGEDFLYRLFDFCQNWLEENGGTAGDTTKPPR